MLVKQILGIILPNSENQLNAMRQAYTIFLTNSVELMQG